MNWQTNEPPEPGRYLCTVEYEEEYDADNDVEICFFTSSKDWLWDESRQSLRDAKVLAWMSLPSLYSADRQSEVIQ